MSQLTYERITNWLVPGLLTALLSVLGWIGINIHEMSKTLAIAVIRVDVHDSRIGINESRISEHEKRIQILETLYLRKDP